MSRETAAGVRAPRPPAARLRLVAITTWAALLLVYAVAVTRSEVTPLEALVALLTFLRDHPLGAAAFVAAYALRPLLFFSAGLLTVGAGILYGPIAGFVVVVLGANAGALLAYALGRLLGADLAGTALEAPRWRGAARALRANTFEAVLLMRLAFAPFDAVNYLAGALRLPPVAFAVATVIGSVPGSLVFLLFGAGLADLAALGDGPLPRVDARLLAGSAALLVVSLALARAVRRRSPAAAAEPSGTAAPERATPFDVVVIGAGSGGLTVAVGMARLGRRVALVERAHVGGDCANVGCVPSKTLLALTAPLGHHGPDRVARRERAAAILAEVRHRRGEVRTHEEGMLAALPGLTLVRGEARLEAPDAGRDGEHGRGSRHVTVSGRDGSRRLRAQRIVLATGSRPVIVDVPGLPPHRVLTNETLFELASPPERLVIIGAGSTGCEMALAFSRLGSEVTLVERAPQVLPAAEPEAAGVVERALAGEGVAVWTGAGALAYDEATRTLRFAGDGAERVVEGVDRVLMACGRRPSVAGLGLEEAGVRLERGAVATDARHRTSAPRVDAIGDVTGRVATTHAANVQGRRLVRRLALPLPLLPEGDYPSVVATDPEVAQIGPTWRELVRRHPAALLVRHRVELADTDRGRTLGLREGYVQLTAMRFTGRLLAATIVAPAAAEMLPLLTVTQRRHGSLWSLSRAVIAYPSLAEAIRRAADAFVFATLPNLPRELATYLRHRWRRPTITEP